jgi:hypothetical protein
LEEVKGKMEKNLEEDFKICLDEDEDDEEEE